ncbi:MAG: flippase-like domain-containing protein [Bacteroidetes bacterium]|nr:flippase-like domain-containing protein [Bacteroidota bacterium]
MTSDKKQTTRRIIHSLKYVLSFLLAGIFLYIAFRGVDFGHVVQTISEASIFWIIVLIISMILSHYLRALRWKIILNSVKKDTSIKNLFGALMVGYGVSCVVPRMGEISRAVVIGKWEKLSRSSMFGTVILERIIDVIFLGLAILISVLIWSEKLYVSFPWLKSTIYITLFLIAFVVAFVYLLVRFKERFYGLIIKVIGKFSTNFAHKAAYIFDMLTQGFASLKGVKNYFYTFGLSVLIMMVYALNAYIGFLTLGMQNIQHVSYSMAWVLMSISAIGVVIPTPGAIGSYEALTKAALVLLFGFGESISLAYAILTHVLSYFLFIFTALFFFFILNKQHENLFKVMKTDLEEL